MPRELPDLLAEGAPRAPRAPDLDAIESRATRRRAGRLGAVALAAVAVLVSGVQALPSAPDRPIIGEAERTDDGATVLPLPAAGQVNPDHANGRPVFVLHDEAGDVRVLDAISPHDSVSAFDKVLAYCRTSGWFVDPMHGSKFDAHGAWAGGPAPYGLAQHEVLAVDDATVTVGSLQAAPARGVVAVEEPRGPDCGDTSTVGGVRLDDLVVHHGVDDDRVPGLVYPERPDDPCCGLLLPDAPQAPIAGAPVVLDAPGAGEVLAAHVGERPVFVVGHEDELGDLVVTVLDAVDPRVTEFAPKVLAWCRPTEPGHAASEFYDPWYRSRFTAEPIPIRRVGARGLPAGGGIPAGGWTGGPAPTGLAHYPVLDGPVPAGTGPATVTVAASPLPAVPRVDLDDLEPDPLASRDAWTPAPSDHCTGRDALLPDSPAADRTLLDDVVLHEPLFPDRWWYPTAERLLGQEPGLPPDELEWYVDALLAERGELDLADLPALGDAGLARQSDLGVELLALDGSSLGIVPDAELVRGERRDGHGGAFLLRDADGTDHWVAPSTGSSLPADGLTVALFERFVEQPDGTWRGTELADDLPPLQGPLHVGNGGRLVTGPTCVGTDACPTPTTIDLDNGGVRTSEPGCVGTDGFADLNLLEVCDGPDGSFVRGLFVPPEDEVRYAMPRYADQPDGSRTIGSVRDAVFGRGDARVVAELSLECEVPRVVGYDGDGAAFDLFGGDRWEDAPASHLLGTVADDGVAGVLVQVLAETPCSEPPTVQPGVWLVTDQHTTQLNQVHGTERLVLWTDAVGDLDDNG